MVLSYSNCIGTSQDFVVFKGTPFFVQHLVFTPSVQKFCRTVLVKVIALKDGVELPERDACFFMTPLIYRHYHFNLFGIYKENIVVNKGL
mmetsp:Transcript_36211/g.61757  ORF Transcript_36211/g.61757 Transcript_36211/m.61757 type:complete len:90 (-) Transcript_36211:75-344(-)